MFKDWNARDWAFVLGFLAILVMGGYAALTSEPEEPEDATPAAVEEPAAPSFDKYSAQVACQSAVKDLLKAPRSAEFPPLSRWQVSSEETEAGTTWKLSGYVDAQNAFGVMIRSDIYCEIFNIADTDRYRIADVDVVSR